MVKRSVYPFIFLTLWFVLATAGCSTSDNRGTNNSQDISRPETEIHEAVLYFADEQAEYLVPEKRNITWEKDELEAEAVVKALIEGPRDKKLGVTIPSGAKLLSVEVKDKIARVDFSEEIRSKHRGGSSGESMTVYSIVNSLTELDGIDKVQILISGQKQDSLVGHLDISQPLARDEEIIKP